MSGWHIPDISKLEKKLNTDVSDGLSAREAVVRLEKEYKKDKKGRKKSLFVPRRSSPFIELTTFFASPFVILLLVMSFLTAFLGNHILGASVFLATLAAAVFGGIVSLRAQKRLEAMKEYSAPMVRVKRGGNLFYTDGRNVVAGDVICLSVGDLLPCDARLIKCDAFIVDELYAKPDGLARRRVLKKCDAVYEENGNESFIAAENMVYAGSAVVGGSALALVVATGSSVYLSAHVPDGALGGKEGEPNGVKILRPFFHKASFISAASVLLLSLLGLLTLNGKQMFICYFTMLLSAVFLITSTLMMFGTKEIFSSFITRLARNKSAMRKMDNSAAIRNVGALDKLTGVNELMIFGTAALYHGEYKVSTAYAAGRVLESLSPETEEGATLLNYVHTSVKAQRDGFVESVIRADGLTDALYAHLKSCKFDISGASLALRSIYFATDSKTGYGFACAETDDSIYRTALTYDGNIVSICEYIRIGNDIRRIDKNDVKNIIEFASLSDKKNERCLYCISEKDGKVIFEGCISVYQPIDTEVSKVVRDMLTFGIKTTVVLQREDERSARIIKTPEFSALFGGRVAYASEFRKEGKKIFEGLGSYCAYVGFNKNEISELVTIMRSKGSRIASFGISNDFNEIMAKTDVAVTCDTLRYSSDKHRYAIYERLPAEGRDTNVRASQQTRLFSKVIVNRSHARGGGIYSIFKAVRMARGAYVSVAQSFLLFTLMMCSVVIFCSMSIITGNILIDPLQAVALAAVIGFLSTTVFSDSQHTLDILSAKKNYVKYPLSLVKKRIPSIIARASVGVVTAIVIKILDVAGVFGETPNYTLPIFLSLILTGFIEVFFINIKYTKAGEGRSYAWLKVTVAYAILLGICATSTQYPFADKFYPNGFGSFEYLIVPAYLLLYLIGIGISRIIENNRNKI